MSNILFVCSRNRWRSLTAETIFKNNGVHAVRSAGTASSARIRVSENLLIWADIIFVMEKRHKVQLTEMFETAIAEKELIVLDIPDDYSYMDTALIETLNIAVAPYINGL